jgi:abequosyltransferase
MTQTSKLSEQPLLTIAIPTYNRAEYLRGSLCTLFDQVIAEPRVELIISDNASTDETPAVIEEVEKRGLRLRHLRNEINLGVDGNFLQCFKHAKGKYLWLLGDDDIVVPGALCKIVTILAAADYALVYLCLYGFRSDYLAERRQDRFRRFAQAVQNGLPFIRKIGIMITFMSSMIVNRDRYRSEERPCLESFVGSGLLHVGWLLPVLGSGGSSLIVWEKLLAVRKSYAGGYGLGRVFSDNLSELLRVTLPGRNDIADAIINPTLRNWFPSMIMQTRWSTNVDREDFRKSLEPLHKGNWRYWVYVFPVAAFPHVAARGWYVVTQLLNRAGRLLVSVLSYPSWRKELIRDSK